jgi:hypothetical protein
MPQTQNAAPVAGRRSSRGCFGGDRDFSAQPTHPQDHPLPEAELASRAYQRLARELPGLLGTQAAALSTFYGALARSVYRGAR